MLPLTPAEAVGENVDKLASVPVMNNIVNPMHFNWSDIIEHSPMLLMNGFVVFHAFGFPVNSIYTKRNIHGLEWKLS